jgi:hypothetical protein
MSKIDASTVTIIAAATGAAGTLLGVVITQVIEVIRLGKESRIRQREKIIERRITAHEAMLSLADDMVVMEDLSDKVKQQDHELPRGPIFLRSLNDFRDWYNGKFVARYSVNHAWLSTKTKREVNLLQDYLINLHKLAEQLQPTNFPELSNDLRNDFIGFSNAIRKSSIKFLSSNAIKLDLKDLQDRHKYLPNETKQKLSTTQLAKKYGKLLGFSG